METILYRTFRKSGGKHYIYPPSFAAPGSEDAARALAAPNDSGAEPSFLLPTDPNTPFYENYNYTSYDWYPDNRLVITTSGTVQVYSIANINDPNNYFQTSGQAPSTIDLLPATVVDEFRVPTNPANFRFIGLDEKLVRIHHAALGSIDFTVEIVDELVLLSPSITSIPPIPANSQPQPSGQVVIQVKAKDNTTDIAQSMLIEARLLTRNGTALFASAWSPLTPAGTLASAPFSLTLPGQYTYEVRVTDNGYEDAFLHLTGSFTITQVVAGATYALSIVTPVTPSSTALGLATGTLNPHFIGGPGVIDVILSQDGAIIKTDYTPSNSSSTSASSVTFSGLSAGSYTITARLEDIQPPNPPGPVTAQVIVEPPPLEIGDQLTFLPWVQPALGNGALMSPPSNPGLRPTLELSATLAIDASQTQPVATTTAEIYGPGDVLGINQRAILATVPVPDAAGFSPLQLAAIDFKEEDLPWRYSMRTAPAIAAVAATATTAAIAATAAAPLPWCMLLVLQADEFEALPLAGQPLPSIRIKASANAATQVYPSTSEQQQKLWAHVQVNKSLASPSAGGTTPAGPPTLPTGPQIEGFLNGELLQRPDLAYSRVLCPRRLKPDTAYQAFLVPALEGGRRAGLGLAFTAIDVRATAIPNAPTTTAVDFPVYFQWKFSTGSEEDFESLVTQLHPANGSTSAATAPNLGVHIAANTYVLPMPALLVDADAAPAPVTAAAQELAVAKYLHAQLVPGRRVGSRPVVTPPLYGRAYMVTPNLLAPTVAVAPSWKHTLNLDPRYRALAALGAQVVQDNQEEYVRRAWEQVQDILLANDKLRGAQYGLRTTTGLRDQHLPLEAAASAGAAGSLTGTTNNVTAPVAANGTSSLAAVTAPGPTPAASARVGMADYGLHLTGLALSRIRVSADAIAAAAEANPSAPLAKVTVREAIRRSSTPLAAFSPTFRRIMKPFGNYQVGEAGRPLRPTQPAPAVLSGDLRQTGTSLAQRDAVLSQLVGGQLTAAPERAEQVRAYQFLDDKVDTLLETSAINNRTLSAPNLSDEANRRFGLAFARFRTQNSNPTAPVKPGDAVHFHKPQYVRPDLPLEAIKVDVVVGTDPGPVFQVRIKQASPVVDTPPAVVAGDYAAPDFNANDFYVGDFGEPGMPVPGDWRAADFVASDFQVDDYLPAAAPAPVPATFARGALAATTPAVPAAPAGLPVIRQAKVTPVFKDPMGEALRLRHPELFVPGLGEFPAGGVAVLDVNRAFLEAYMVGLNHALGSELLWRGFPVDVRGTFFQQFWDVREHFNTTLAPGEVPSAAAEAAMLDIKPLDQWIGRALGSNAPDLSILNSPGQPSSPARVANPLRMAVRSELLRRYPNLVLALQLKTELTADPALMLHPLQRLAVGQDMVVVTFDVEQAWAKIHHNLVLMERPGQPKFGLDETAPAADQPVPPQTTIANPLSWNDFSWEYLGTPAGSTVTISPTGRPHATAEPREVAYLTDSATVAYALFQEPIMATIPLSGLVD